MTIRLYDAERDLEAIRRIWREIGWIDGDEIAPMDAMLTACSGMVGEVRDEAECFVIISPGTIRHLRTDIPMTGVAGVTTSRVARLQGLAGRTTARSIANGVADGAAVAALGMFEQGFYDRLGFGSGSYEYRCAFDPTTLRVEPTRRPPRRITMDDWREAHACRLRRRLRHGACNLHEPGFTQADMLFSTKGFGLGYDRDGGKAGELSHYIWLGVSGDAEHGPYRAHWLAYENREQLLELLGLLRTLGDQFRHVTMGEPPDLQLQDLIDMPMRKMWATRRSERDSRTIALAFWQVRICDLQQCLVSTSLPSGEIRFNLELDDPIERYFEQDDPWRGIGGKYIVTLGRSSGAEAGVDASLPTLKASVGAFSRLWLGVRDATTLATSDTLSGPETLLQELDDVLRLPSPHIDWDF